MWINWTKIVSDMHAHYGSLKKMAAALDVAKTSLIDYRDGRNTPRHAQGEWLLDCWAHTTGVPREQVPHLPYSSLKPELRRKAK